MGKQTKNKQKRDLNCPVTGLKVEDKETALEAISYIDAQNEQNKAIKKAIKEDYGLAEKKFIWQKGKFFNKVYKKSHTKILKLSANSKSLLLTLICLSDRMDNSIRYEDKPISNPKLIELSGLSVHILRQSIKELVELKFISIKGGNRNRRIYLNPKIVEDTATEEYVHDMFK